MYEKSLELSNSAIPKCLNLQVSAYRTVFEETPVNANLYHICTRIQSGRYAALVAQIRQEADKKKRQKLKLKLPAFATSGIYNGKAEGEPVSPTGLIQIDIDELPPNCTAQQASEFLKDDPFTFIMFRSPSGQGLKLLVKITKDRDSFLGHFHALEQYYGHRYFIKIDTKCKNINRLCYLSHDPHIYIKPDALPYRRTEKPPRPELPRQHQKGQVFSHPSTARTKANVERLIQVIDFYQIDITSDYGTWIRIGFSLVSAFGEEGEDYFVRISRHYPEYSEHDTRKKYRNLLNRNPKAQIGTLFGIAADHGVMMQDDAVA